jgi:hypothetical protein
MPEVELEHNNLSDLVPISLPASLGFPGHFKNPSLQRELAPYDTVAIAHAYRTAAVEVTHLVLQKRSVMYVI